MPTRPAIPAPSSTAVPGSGTKCRVRKPKAGTTVEPAMSVLMTIGVTKRTRPEGAAVELVAEAGPWAKPRAVRVSKPVGTATLPEVQPAPATVTFTRKPTEAVPPLPITDSGTDTFAGGASSQATNRQTLAMP